MSRKLDFDVMIGEVQVAMMNQSGVHRCAGHELVSCRVLDRGAQE
jgi:hypothetical protein